VREVSTALGNTPKVARDSYIDPRVIDAYADGRVITLPDGVPATAAPLRIHQDSDGVVIELPTEVDADALRLQVERTVRELVSSRRSSAKAKAKAAA
jgi:hypothetical protein